MQREAIKKLNLKNYSLARNYTKRTTLNVQDSDGTLIINRGELDGGTDHTARLAEKLKNPYLIMQLEDQPNLNKITHWLNKTTSKPSTSPAQEKTNDLEYINRRSRC